MFDNPVRRVGAHGGFTIVVLGVVTCGLVTAMRPSATRALCAGDCNGNHEVTIDDIGKMVNVALAAFTVSACQAGDLNRSGGITIDEIILAIGHALTACPPPNGTGACGDGELDTASDEECDNAGVCMGGTNAGTFCQADASCEGDGVCDALGFPGGGQRKACSTDADCAGARCVRCKPFGGDGCAANCTLEESIRFPLAPGVVEGSAIRIATSGALVHGDSTVIPLPFAGTQTFLAGKPRSGRVSVAQRPEGTVLGRVTVSTFACACIRSVVFKTCGGTVMESDGATASLDCTTDASVCAGGKPCTSVAGPDNSGEGTLACDRLEGINVAVTQDADRGAGSPAPPVLTVLPGSGGPGSALIPSAAAIATIVGPCSGSGDAYGADGEFCTDDDPPSARGTPMIQVLTTGRASATLLNANGIGDNDIGPLEAVGVSLNCGELVSRVISGAALAGASTSLDQPLVGDVAATVIFVAR